MQTPLKQKIIRRLPDALYVIAMLLFTDYLVQIFMAMDSMPWLRWGFFDKQMLGVFISVFLLTSLPVVALGRLIQVWVVKAGSETRLERFGCWFLLVATGAQAPGLNMLIPSAVKPYFRQILDYAGPSATFAALVSMELFYSFMSVFALALFSHFVFCFNKKQLFVLTTIGGITGSLFAWRGNTYLNLLVILANFTGALSAYVVLNRSVRLREI